MQNLFPWQAPLRPPQLWQTEVAVETEAEDRVVSLVRRECPEDGDESDQEAVATVPPPPPPGL